MQSETIIPFAGSNLDRAAHLRGKPDELYALITAANSRFLPLWQGKPLIYIDDESLSLAWQNYTSMKSYIEKSQICFMGLDHNIAHFCADLSHIAETEQTGLTSEVVKFIDLRSIAGQLPAEQASVGATAKGVLAWHQSHQFCSQCGHRNISADAGWRRDCTSCKRSHFPRTDPVVIMLIEHDDKCIMGRQEGWPDGTLSVLAGFMEPGESIEEAVQREVYEEVNVQVGEVKYFATQPWPFPHTLMIGCIGQALTTELTPDYDELETAQWVSKDEIRKAIAGDDVGFAAPRKDAIARIMVEAWANDRLPK